MADNPKTPPKPTEEEVKNTPEHEKNVDRDGREQQPNAHTDQK
jgi:hypothetical protein